MYSHLAVVNLVRKVAHENRGAALGLLAQRLLAPLALPRSALRPAHLRRASHTRLCAHAQGKAWPHAKPAPLPPYTPRADFLEGEARRCHRARPYSHATPRATDGGSKVDSAHHCIGS